MATPFDEDDRFIRDGRSLARWLPLLIEQERAARRAAENAISAMYWGAPVADVTALSNGAPDLNAHHRALAAAVSAALVDPAWDGQRYLRDLVATLHADEARDERLRALESRLDDLTFGLVSDNVNDEEVSEDAAAHGVDRGLPPDLTDVPALQAEIRELHRHQSEGKLANSFGPYALRVVLELARDALLVWPELTRRLLSDRVAARSIIKSIARLGSRGAVFAPQLLDAAGAASAGAGGRSCEPGEGEAEPDVLPDEASEPLA